MSNSVSDAYEEGVKQALASYGLNAAREHQTRPALPEQGGLELGAERFSKVLRTQKIPGLNDHEWRSSFDQDRLHKLERSPQWGPKYNYPTDSPSINPGIGAIDGGA